MLVHVATTVCNGYGFGEVGACTCIIALGVCVWEEYARVFAVPVVIGCELFVTKTHTCTFLCVQQSGEESSAESDVYHDTMDSPLVREGFCIQEEGLVSWGGGGFPVPIFCINLFFKHSASCV